MSFKFVYHSQQDPQWKNDILGFGAPGDTIGEYGCALTSMAMLLSGHGYPETPKTLNEKMKNSGGFQGDFIVWGAIKNIHPQITLREQVVCETTDAPLAKIDAALAAGQPVVVRVDSSPAPKLQWHYVLVYARKGNDYLMLDPYPYKPGTATEDLLMARYSQGQPLQRSIQQILFYQCSTADGTIPTPGSSAGTTGTPHPQPKPAPVPSGGVYARPTSEVSAFVNMRSSTDTSSMANVLAQIYPGEQVLIVEAGGESKLGVNGQFVRVSRQGVEGFAAAWFLEKVPGTAPAPSPAPTPSPVSEAPASTPAPSAPAPAPSAPAPQMDPNKNYLAVSDATILRKTASNSGEAQMNLTPGMLLIVIEPYAKAKGKLGQQNQWIYVRGPNKKPGYVLSQFVRLP
jgi:hypothetical protein